MASSSSGSKSATIARSRCHCARNSYGASTRAPVRILPRLGGEALPVAVTLLARHASRAHGLIGQRRQIAKRPADRDRKLARPKGVCRAVTNPLLAGAESPFHCFTRFKSMVEAGA